MNRLPTHVLTIVIAGAASAIFTPMVLHRNLNCLDFMATSSAAAGSEPKVPTQSKPR